MRARLPGLVATALLGALPGVAMLRLYSGSRAAVVLVGAALVSTALVALASRIGHRRAPLLLALGVQVVGFVAYSVATTGTGFADGFVHGWARLLSTAPPVDPSAAMLVPAIALTWVASAGGGELWMRPGPLLRPIAPAAVGVIAGAVFAGGHELPAIPLSCAFLVGAAALLLGGERLGAGGHRGAMTVVSGGTDADHPNDLNGTGQQATTRVHRSRRARRVPGAAAVLGVATLAVASAAGPSLQFGRDRHPFDPRQHVTPPPTSLTAVSPLDLMASRLDDPKVPMFKVRSADPEDWQLAVLDDFDGYDWSAAHEFEATGSQLPAQPQTGAQLSRVNQTFTVQQLTGPWLPAAAEPVHVSGVSFDTDLQSGALIATDGKAQGKTYQVTSEVANPNLSALQSAATAITPEAMADRALPAGMPNVLREVAATATSGVSAPLDQALLLERYLRLNYHLDTKATAGHSYGHLVQFLTQTKQGTSEQFATAFAVLGRSVGLPTRVVVGFGPGSEVSPGVWQVTSGDVLAWPQVDFAGVGWVTFDPTPAANDAKNGSLPVGGPGTKGQTSFVVSGANAKPQAPMAPIPSPGATGGAGAHGGAAAHTGSNGAPWWLFLVVAVAALLVVVAVAAAGVVVAKQRRVARRRRTGSPRQRIAGAWAEVLDRLAEQGHPDPSTLTVAEAIAAADRGWSGKGRGEAVLAGMYRPVNQALFSAAEPEEHAADQAWRCYDRYRAQLARRRSLVRRMVVAVDPRPLFSSSSSQTDPSTRRSSRTRRKGLSWA